MPHPFLPDATRPLPAEQNSSSSRDQQPMADSLGPNAQFLEKGPHVGPSFQQSSCSRDVRPLEHESFELLPSAPLSEWTSSGAPSASGFFTSSSPTWIDHIPSQLMMMAGTSAEPPLLTTVAPAGLMPMDDSNIYPGMSTYSIGESSAGVLNSNLLMKPGLFRPEESSCNEVPQITSLAEPMTCKPVEKVPTHIEPHVSHPTSNTLLRRPSEPRPTMTKLYRHSPQTAPNFRSSDKHLSDEKGPSKKRTAITTTTTTASGPAQSQHEPEPQNCETSALKFSGMQPSRPNQMSNLDELDMRGERLKERVDSSCLQSHELKRSLDRLEPELQYLKEASVFTYHQYQVGSVSHPTVPPSRKRLCQQIPMITPKDRPKLPEVVVKGFPLRKLSPDHDPTVPKAVAPVGLNPTSAQIRDWPRRGDAAHRLSFILNPTMNPAKENKRDLEPSSTESANSQDADNLGSDESRRQTVGISESLTTVSILGSGAPGSIQSKSLENEKIDPRVVKEHFETFFKRYSNRLTWFPVVESTDVVFFPEC